MAKISKVLLPNNEIRDINDLYAVHGTGITNIVKIYADEYEALATKDANTIYVVEPRPSVSST